MPTHLGARQGLDCFFELCALPRTLKSGKGECLMTFEQVVLLLTLIGGVIHITFEITWKIFSSYGNKKEK